MYAAVPTRTQFKHMLFLISDETIFFPIPVKTNLVMIYAVPGEQYEKKSTERQIGTGFRQHQ